MALNESRKPFKGRHTNRMVGADGNATGEFCAECEMEPGEAMVLLHIDNFEEAIASAAGKLRIECALLQGDEVVSSDVMRFGKEELSDYPENPTQRIR